MKSKDLTLADILPGSDYGIGNSYLNPSLRASRDHWSENSAQQGAVTYLTPATYEYAMTQVIAEDDSGTYIRNLFYYFMKSEWVTGHTYPFRDFFIDDANGVIIDNLLANYILPRMDDTIVCSVDDIDDENKPLNAGVDILDICAIQTSKKAGKRFMQMLSWLYSDGKERIKLISLMQDNLNNLLNKVETINRRRDNNTPQNAANPDADPHLSYYSKNVNETDMMTLMARIKEIKNGIFDEYQEWANEFEEKFAIMCL